MGQKRVSYLIVDTQSSVFCEAVDTPLKTSYKQVKREQDRIFSFACLSGMWKSDPIW